MSAVIALSVFLGLLLLLLVGLFLYFCHGDFFTKAASTVLITLAGLGGSKVTPAHRGTVDIMTSFISIKGDYDVGGERTDTTILIVVLGVALIALIGCYFTLKLKGKPI